MNKIGLGTVQFGCPYGISNRHGQVPQEEVCRILRTARLNGIDMLDTACLYEQAEEALNQADISAYNIVTKTNIVDPSSSLEENLRRIQNSFENSLRLLAPGGSLYGCLFHESQDLIRTGGEVLWASMERYKKEGRLRKLGVSVYTPEQLMRVMEKFPIDIVQFPLNLLDQRFLPLIPELKSKGIEVHVRSVFLQGLLLMHQEEIDPWFDEIKPALARIPRENRLKTALDFVLSVKMIDRVIVGVTSCQDLVEILRVSEAPPSPIEEEYTSFAIEDEKYIMPFNWKK